MLLVRDPNIKSLADFKDQHRIAVPAMKVSMQAIMLQMAAAKEVRRCEVQFARSSDGVDGASGCDRIDARRAERDRRQFLVGAVPVPADEEPRHPPHSHQHGSVRRAAVVQRHRDDVEIPAGQSEALRRIPGGAEGSDRHDQHRQAERSRRSISRSPTTRCRSTIWSRSSADPAIQYTTKVGGINAFVSFMAKTGTLKNPPADWKEMFFPEALAAK